MLEMKNETRAKLRTETLSLALVSLCCFLSHQVVQRSGKELIIEKQLKKMEEIWAGLNLTFTKHKTLDCHVLDISDSIKEALDTDNLQLQSLANSK